MANLNEWSDPQDRDIIPIRTGFFTDRLIENTFNVFVLFALV